MGTCCTFSSASFCCAQANSPATRCRNCRRVANPVTLRTLVAKSDCCFCASQLLNSTIQSIAISVNKVLTATYHAVYDDAKEGDELTLLTAPLCSTAELQSLFEAGVVDIESALPAALHSLGCTAVEIAGAVKRRKQADQAGTDTKLLEVQNAAKIGDADVALKAAQTGKTTAETEVVKQQVAKTKAETKKTLHDASAPHVKPGATGAGGTGAGGTGGGSSGGGSSGGGSSGGGSKSSASKK